MTSIKRTWCLVAALLMAAAPFARAGDPPPVLEGRGEFEMVLIHDLGSNAKVWNDVLPFLKGTFKVWTFEMSGHGATPPVPQASIDEEARRLGDYLAAEGIAYPTLVGHGVGGMVALRYALDHPAQVHRLILLDSTARPLATPAEQLATAASLAKDYDRTVAERCLNMSPSEDVTNRILDDALRTDSASYIGLLGSTNTFDVTSELEGLTVPLLIVGSELMFPEGIDSRAVIAHVGYAHARTLSFKRIEKAGHFMMLERPVYLASVLLAFGVTAEYEFQR
ncbi:MAG TPA: alpha/beta hydrolase [Candidatus Krumholzibacteria bacterium]|nr:alpha/beta hydrolase [Candidatus Krumholzibacteria bacterium]